GLRGRNEGDVARVLRNIGNVDGAFFLRGDAGDALPDGQADLFAVDLAGAVVLAGVETVLVVDQQDGRRLQMEVVAHDAEDLQQDLVELEGREDRLARVVKDGDFLHGLTQYSNGR